MKSVDAVSGPSKITPQSSATWTVTQYTDNLNYPNAMYPAPTFTWSSGNTSIATVNSTTGQITGVAVGTTTIRATGANGVFKDFPLTVAGCTAVALNPNTTQQLYFNGPTTNVVAGLTCPSGIDPNKELVDWTSSPTAIVSLTPYGSYGHGVTINPSIDGGVTTVMACTRYTVNKVCGQVTANVARLVITPLYYSAWDSLPPGTVEHIQLFSLYYKGAGAPIHFSFSCGSTGQITCNGQPTPASQTISAGTTLNPTMNFTTNNTGQATIGFGATDFDGHLPFTNLWIPITITNVMGGSLSAYLQGILDVKVSTTCTWNAGASGGTLPYHYSWTVDGSGVGGDSPSLSYAFGSVGTYNITVAVSDAAGGYQTASRDVTVHTDWDGCLQ